MAEETKKLCDVCRNAATFNVAYSFVKHNMPETFEYLTGRYCDFHKEYIEENVPKDEFMAKRIVSR